MVLASRMTVRGGARILARILAKYYAETRCAGRKIAPPYPRSPLSNALVLLPCAVVVVSFAIIQGQKLLCVNVEPWPSTPSEMSRAAAVVVPVNRMLVQGPSELPISIRPWASSRS